MANQSKSVCLCINRRFDIASLCSWSNKRDGLSWIMKTTIFWDITASSSFSVNRRFGGTYRLHLQGRRNKFSKKPSSKEVDTQRTTRRYIPEDGTLHNHRCENLKSYLVFFSSFTKFRDCKYVTVCSGHLRLSQHYHSLGSMGSFFLWVIKWRF
jgi:hypothetical protein